MAVDPVELKPCCSYCGGKLATLDVTPDFTSPGRRLFEDRCLECSRADKRWSIARVGSTLEPVRLANVPTDPETRDAVAADVVSIRSTAESWGGRPFIKGWDDQDVRRGPSCSERCYVVRYIDPDGPYDVMRAMLRCDVQTHAAAAVRRYIEDRAAAIYRCDGMVFDRVRRVVLVDGVERHLTPQYLLALEVLTLNAGEYVTSDTVYAWLFERSEGKLSSSDPGHYVYILMYRLRRALDGRNTLRFITSKPSQGLRVPPNQEVKS